MKTVRTIPLSLARTLILEELFDLHLYTLLRSITQGPLRDMLNELVAVETKHLAFWRGFFPMQLARLTFGRRLKLRGIALLCRLFGEDAIHLTLEAIEVAGIQRYLTLLELYRGQELGDALESILRDEFEHEDKIVMRIVERKINPEKIRSVFLGLNDGLVEILGALSGFFAAFQGVAAVLAAVFAVSVAGSLSMAAGAFIAASSAGEIRKMEEGKQKFLKQGNGADAVPENPFSSAFLVGISYFAGTMIPVVPVLFGARSLALPVLIGAVVVIVVSSIAAFLSGMDIRRRIVLNTAIVAGAVVITYAIGMAAKALFGVSVV